VIKIKQFSLFLLNIITVYSR